LKITQFQFDGKELAGCFFKNRLRIQGNLNVEILKETFGNGFPSACSYVSGTHPFL
jgi:hypothetical protein